MADETHDSLTGTAKPLCAHCGSDEHLGPECPTLTASASSVSRRTVKLDEDAEGSR